MKVIGDIAYLEYQELLNLNISESTLKLAKHRQSASWVFINDPADRRRVLIQYSTLKDKYKQLVHATYGDPYEYMRNQTALQNIAVKSTLSSYVVETTEDREFFLTQGVHDTKVKDYCRASAWLRFMTSGKPSEYKSATDFYTACLSYIQSENISGLKVNNIRVLQRKLSAFKTSGPACLIHKNNGNKNGEKFGNAEKLYLRNIFSDPRKFPIFECWIYYTQEAKRRGWEEVSHATVYNYLNQPDVQMQCYAMRHGMAPWRNSYDPVITRMKPTHANDMWVMDGTPLELYYTDGKSFHNRFYVYMVVDAATWHIVGYAIGQTETAALVEQALKVACSQTQSLPYQLQYDNSSANKHCEPLIKRIANIAIPAQVGNARAKVIEAINGHFNRMVLKKFYNHSGGNITAGRLDTHANTEFLKQFKNEVIPTADVCLQQIHAAIDYWNEMPDKEGITRTEKYAIKSDYHRTLSNLMRIDIFGKERQRTATYTNNGLVIEIEGKRTHYWVDDKDFYLQNVGREFTIKVDEDNLAFIALYHEGKLVRVAEQKKLIPMARVNFLPGDQRELHHQLAFKEGVKQEITDRNTQDRQAIEAEGYLKNPIQIGTQFKDLMNGAETVLKRLPNTTTNDDTYEGFNLYGSDEEEGGFYDAHQQ